MAHPALLALIFSGFVTLLLNSWGLLYKANLLIHPLLGVGFTAVMFYFAWRRFSLLEHFWARLWVAVPIGLSLGLALPGVASPVRFYAQSGLLVAWLAVGLWRLSRAVALREWLVAACNYIGFGLWVLSVHSGLSILSLAHGGGITHIVVFHRTVNIAFTAMFVLMILLSLAGVFARSQAFADAQPRILASLAGLLSRGRGVRDEQPRAWSALVLTLLTFGLLAALVGVERGEDLGAPSFTVPLSTIPLERRIDSEKAVSFTDPRLAPAALDLSASCGSGSGCHEAIVRSFRDSNHNTSAMTPHIQKSFALMSGEVGAHNTKTCAGCHTPAMLFDAKLDQDHFRSHGNMSCSFCHMVSDTWIGPKHSLRSSYTLRPPIGHLDLFLDHGVEKPLSAFDATLIRLSPTSHARQFSSRLLSSDRFCDSCHHQQIRTEQQIGLVKPRCIDCHMRSLDEMGGHGAQRSHFFPGANAAVPLLASRKPAAQLVGKWIDGKFPFSIPGWENRGWERLGGRPFATWLWMLFEAKQDARPGTNYGLDIITANVGIGHRFPAAPYDLVEAWLEVRVRDAKGRIVFEHGLPDPAGHLASDAHRLGGRVLGEDGAPIEHYRVWLPQHDVIDRVLEEGVPVRDHYTFDIPSDVKGPLTIAAEWKYRKLNRDFLDWAYGPQTTVPAVVVGSLSGTIPLAGSGPLAGTLPHSGS